MRDDDPAVKSPLGAFGRRPIHPLLVRLMTWLTRLRGTLGTGLTWAAAWAVGGLAMGVSSVLLPFLPWDRFFAVFDAPLPALAIPGFVGGVLFSLVVRVAGRRSRFGDLSMPRFACWGAVGGLLLTAVPVLLIGAGALSGEAAGGSTAAAALLRVASAIALPFVALGAASAAGSLWIARRATERASLSPAADDDASRRPAQPPLPAARARSAREPR